MNYFVPRIFLSQVAYGLTLPVEVTVRDLLENESASFTLEVQPDSILFLSDFARSGTELDETSITGHLLDLTPPLERASYIRHPIMPKGEAYTLSVGKTSLYNTVSVCSSGLSVSLNNEKSSIVDLSYRDYSTKNTCIIVRPFRKSIHLKNSGIFEEFTAWHSHIYWWNTSNWR